MKWSLILLIVILSSFPVALSANKTQEQICKGGLSNLGNEITIHSYGVDASPETLDQVLSVQATRIKAENDPAPEGGFLIYKMDSAEFQELLRDESGQVFVAKHNDLVVGYAIVTNFATEAKGLVEDASLQTQDGFRKNWLSEPATQSLKYIYQIGIRPEFSRRGIGQKIINQIKLAYPAGVVADIFSRPENLSNIASYRIFLKSGFIKVGDLLFPHYEKHLMVWQKGETHL